jgi:N-glycosylase/DNA lyase
LFEDIVKTICTTNTRWAQTKRMVANLVAAFGEPWPLAPEWRAFPTPAALAAAGEAGLRAAGLGYRAAAVAELARRVRDGALDPEAWKDPALPEEALRRQVAGLRGVGPYATATLLMLLGRYAHLAIDSELRAFTARHYFGGAATDEAAIRALYAPWGWWQYLAYWFDPGQGDG